MAIPVPILSYQPLEQIFNQDSTKTGREMYCKSEAQSDRSQQLRSFSAAPLKIEPCHSSTRWAAGRIETLSWRQSLISSVSIQFLDQPLFSKSRLTESIIKIWIVRASISS